MSSGNVSESEYLSPLAMDQSQGHLCLPGVGQRSKSFRKEPTVWDIYPLALVLPWTVGLACISVFFVPRDPATARAGHALFL